MTVLNNRPEQIAWSYFETKNYIKVVLHHEFLVDKK